MPSSDEDGELNWTCILHGVTVEERGAAGADPELAWPELRHQQLSSRDHSGLPGSSRWAGKYCTCSGSQGQPSGREGSSS